MPFRKTEEYNEIELLILVTPEFVDPMDAGEAPCGGPGTFTTSAQQPRPVLRRRAMEVPTECNPTKASAHAAKTRVDVATTVASATVVL